MRVPIIGGAGFNGSALVGNRRATAEDSFDSWMVTVLGVLGRGTMLHQSLHAHVRCGRDWACRPWREHPVTRSKVVEVP